MCKTLGAILLTVVNVVFMLCGAALLIVGALLQWGQDFVKNTLTPLLGKLAGGTALGGASGASLSITEISKLIDSYLAVLGNAGLIIFILGCVLFCLAFLGVCGVACKSKILMIVYIIIMSVIFVIIVVFVGLFFGKRNEIQAKGLSELQKVIKNQYTFNLNLNTLANSKTSGLDISGIIDLLQARIGCCGAANYTDFHKSSKYAAYQTAAVTGATGAGMNLIPTSCCIMASPASFTPKETTCIKSLSATSSYYNKGCYAELWTIIDKYSTYSAYALIGIAVLMFILLIIACVLFKQYSKDVF